MPGYVDKDLEILELLFYAGGVGFSIILEHTKLSKSSLFRHLNYLTKIGYIEKIVDERRKVYELTQKGDRQIIPVLLEKNHLKVFSQLKNAMYYEDMKTMLLKRKEHEFLVEEARKRARFLAKRARKLQ
jgi:DNA-binding MarR family transcriptional regulator